MGIVNFRSRIIGLFIRLVFTACAATTFTAHASADTVFITGVTDVLFGTVTLSSASGPVISSRNAMSVETGFGSGSIGTDNSPLPAPQLQQIIAVIGTSLGSNLVSQIQSDPAATLGYYPSFGCGEPSCPVAPDRPIPSWVLGSLANFVTANGLGLAAATPDPATIAFNAQLGQPVPFTTTNVSTSAVNFDINYTYQTDFVSSLSVQDDPTNPNPPIVLPQVLGLGDPIVFLINVNFFEIDVTEQVASVPEPSTWAMMLIGFASLGFIGYRRKSKPALSAA
jgi:hypothetical protein